MLLHALEDLRRKHVFSCSINNKSRVPCIERNAFRL